MSEEPDDSDRSNREHDRPPADRQSGGQPQGGQPPNQPQGGQPPNQPQGGQGGQPPNQPQGGQGGQPPNQPQGGQPPNQPQGGQPPNQPQGGQPPNQPQGGQPQGQPRGQQPPGNRRQPATAGGRAEEVNFAIFGVVTYAIVGLGVFLSALLGSLLGGDASLIVSSNNELFNSARDALGSLVTLAPIAGAVLGVYYHRTDTTMQRPAKAAGIAAAAGVFAISVLLVLFMLLFEPSGGSGAAAGFQGSGGVSVELGDEILAVLGITIGTALAAAGTGFVLEEDPLDIF